MVYHKLFNTFLPSIGQFNKHNNLVKACFNIEIFIIYFKHPNTNNPIKQSKINEENVRKKSQSADFSIIGKIILFHFLTFFFYIFIISVNAHFLFVKQQTNNRRKIYVI